MALFRVDVCTLLQRLRAWPEPVWKNLHFEASRALESLRCQQVQRAFEGDMAGLAPVGMYRTWGASWELVGVPTPPLDFTLTDISGSTVTARRARPPRDCAMQLA